MGIRDDLPLVIPHPLPEAWPTPPAGEHEASPSPHPAVAAEGTPANVPADTGARPRGRPWVWLLSLALVAAGAGGWTLNRSAGGPPNFLTATAQRGALEETVSATGTLQPLQYVDVGTQVTGQLRALPVAIGDMVAKGQLIAEIDPTLFQAKTDATRAALDSLEAQLVDRQAQLQLAEQLLARNHRLLAAHAVTDQFVQQSETAALQAQAQVNAVRAQIQQTRSALAGDAANLRYTRIYAPMAGTVVDLSARRGQTLVSSQQAQVILRIADLRTMTVWAQVSEADVPRLRVGMPVYFNTLGLPERRWHGQVRQVLPTPATVNNVVLYNVLFDVANADGTLKPQMSAQVFFRVAAVDDALTVPSAALRTAGQTTPATRATAATAAPGAGREKAYVVRVLRGDAVEERPVTVGLQTRLQAQILSGLAEGETVIVGSAPAKGGAGKAGAIRAAL